MVVIDRPETYVDPHDVLAAATTEAEKLRVPIVDLPLSVRCRQRINQLQIKTLDGLLHSPPDTVRQHLGDSLWDQLQEMLEAHGLHWLQ